MATENVPYGRKTQRKPALEEVHILWINDGMSCDGVPIQQELSEPDHRAAELIRLRQPEELGVGQRAAERCERGNQLILASFSVRPLVLAHRTYQGTGVPGLPGMRPLSLIRPSAWPAWGRQRLTAVRRELAAVVPHRVNAAAAGPAGPAVTCWSPWPWESQAAGARASSPSSARM